MPNFSGTWTRTQQMQATGQSIWPSAPGAPTIGTATATSSTTATVAFTAPANAGYPATITGYTATSSPGGLTGTGSSSPVTVSGLSGGTAYTFTVTATNASGTGPPSAASNSVTTLYTIGQALGGGFYAGQISTAGNSVADYNLVIGPVASAQSTLQFKIVNTGGESTSVIDGPGNTTAMNDATHPAAQFCKGLTIGGFSDWYMPAKNELEICYFNLKPTTTSNVTSSGINANAVPARASNYTTSIPAQTSAAAFKIGTGAEAFAFANYWSSSQYPPNGTEAWAQYFPTGLQGYNYKNEAIRTRAVRRVAV
jgi:hypothetical protein